jgi:hypothetical protein
MKSCGSLGLLPFARAEQGWQVVACAAPDQLEEASLSELAGIPRVGQSAAAAVKAFFAGEVSL